MDYKDIDDGELLHMLHESSEDAKDILFEKYKYIIDIEIRKYTNVAKKLGYDLHSNIILV